MSQVPGSATPATTIPMLRVALCSLIAFASLASGLRADDANVLWYRHPATQWVEALPIGNGRLGAMVFGGMQLERLQLNEDTLWGGGPYDPANPAARAALPKI